MGFKKNFVGVILFSCTGLFLYSPFSFGILSPLETDSVLAYAREEAMLGKTGRVKQIIQSLSNSPLCYASYLIDVYSHPSLRHPLPEQNRDAIVQGATESARLILELVVDENQLLTESRGLSLHSDVSLQIRRAHALILLADNHFENRFNQYLGSI